MSYDDDMICGGAMFLAEYWDTVIQKKAREMTKPVRFVGRVEMEFYAEQLRVEFSDTIETDYEIFKLAVSLEYDYPVENSGDVEIVLCGVGPCLQEQTAAVRQRSVTSIDLNGKHFYPVGFV